MEVHFIIQHVDECAWFLGIIIINEIQVCMYVCIYVLFLVMCILLGNIGVLSSGEGCKVIVIYYYGEWYTHFSIRLLKQGWD